MFRYWAYFEYIFSIINLVEILKQGLQFVHFIEIGWNDEMQVNGWNLIFSVPVYNSLEDHHHEIMSFCWENGYHGVLSDEGEFALYNPPKYFSAHDLKLSYQVRGHSITTWTRWGGEGVKKCLFLSTLRL